MFTSRSFDEYTGSRVSSTPAYATLGLYNTGYGAGPMAPVPMTSMPTNTVIVPQFSAPGYNALQNGFPSGYGAGGYYNLMQAYPDSPTNCTQYGNRPCF